MRRLGERRGQATVEIVALLPVILGCVLAVAAVLGAGAASEAAGSAAEAGAAAIVQEGDPKAAAQQALDPSSVERATIEVSGRRVTVTVRPDTFPSSFSRWLAATRSADAGPGPAVEASTTVVRGGDGDSARPAQEHDGEDGSRP